MVQEASEDFSEKEIQSILKFKEYMNSALDTVDKFIKESTVDDITHANITTEEVVLVKNKSISHILGIGAFGDSSK